MILHMERNYLLHELEESLDLLSGRRVSIRLSTFSFEYVLEGLTVEEAFNSLVVAVFIVLLGTKEEILDHLVLEKHPKIVFVWFLADYLFDHPRISREDAIKHGIVVVLLLGVVDQSI